MKKYLALLIWLCASSAFAQNPTAVSGTITDPNGIAYYPATVTATLTPSATNPTVGGQPINPNPGTPYVAGPVNTSSNGSFSIPLFANGDITPAATQYVITVAAAGTAPPAGLGPQTFLVTVTISGSSQSLTTTLNAAALALLPTSTGTSVAFSAVTTGTNATALHMGTGGSLNATGGGTIAATSAPFSGVSTGTNAVALHVGTGGTLDATGSGTIHATTSDAATLAAAATALAATPTLCSGGTPLAAGVLANGNATGCQAASGGNLTAEYIIGDTTVGTLTNALAWPSLYNSPDAPPASRNAMDDEFDGASLNTPNNIWTWTNQGATTETQANGYAKIVNSTSNGSSHVARFIGQPLPAPPYTFICKVGAPGVVNFSFAGMYLWETATSKWTQLGFEGVTGGSALVASANAAANTFTTTGGLVDHGYLMINRTTTTLTYSYSPDGITYTPIMVHALTTDFTTAPDIIGVGVNPYSATAVLDVDFFRRTL